MTISIRPATPADSGAILDLIRLQAAFEGEAGAVALTEDVIRRDAFGEHPRFRVLLAEAQRRKLVGLAVLLEGYSSWRGAPTLIIHDLFVREDARGSGAGAALLSAAARLAGEAGCCRIDVNVLDWNVSARRFYEHLGFAALDHWRPYRIDSEAMARLARR